MPEASSRGESSWSRKFRCAFRGVKRGIRGESSFFVHFFVAALVLTAAATLDADRTEQALLWLCIVGVLTCELFNSSIERLARAVDENFNPHLRDALDIAGGAVLCAALGAAVLGTAVLGRLTLAACGYVR